MPTPPRSHFRLRVEPLEERCLLAGEPAIIQQVAVIPTPAPENTAVVLQVSFDDPESGDQHTVAINWGDGATQNLTLPQGARNFSVPHVYQDNQPGNAPYAISFAINDGAVDALGTAQAAITNLAPTAAIAGPASAIAGQPRSFTFSAKDASPVDNAAGFTYLIDWGDGTFDFISATPGNGAGVTVPHAFAQSGSLKVTARAFDKDGAVSATASHPVNVAPFGVQGGTLVVGGTGGDDRLIFEQGGQGIIVRLNGSAFGPFTGVKRIIAFGNAGNDFIRVAGNIEVPVELYGDAGDDRILSGGGPGLLVGGDGNDVIRGARRRREPRDIVIGDQGNDVIGGGDGEDLLIADAFMPGATFAEQQAALRKLARIWQGAGDFAARSRALQAFLAPRVVDDGRSELLVGGCKPDLFVAPTGAPLTTVFLPFDDFKVQPGEPTPPPG